MIKINLYIENIWNPIFHFPPIRGNLQKFHEKKKFWWLFKESKTGYRRLQIYHLDSISIKWLTLSSILWCNLRMLYQEESHLWDGTDGDNRSFLRGTSLSISRKWEGTEPPQVAQARATAEHSQRQSIAAPVLTGCGPGFSLSLRYFILKTQVLHRSGPETRGSHPDNECRPNSRQASLSLLLKYAPTSLWSLHA